MVPSGADWLSGAVALAVAILSTMGARGRDGPA